MLPPLPRCSGWAHSSLKTAPSISAFRDSTVGSACTSSFSRFARRSLALRPAHSRGHQFRDRYPGASDILSPTCLPRLLPAGANRRVGLAPTGKSAALSRRTWIADIRTRFPHELTDCFGNAATATPVIVVRVALPSYEGVGVSHEQSLAPFDPCRVADPGCGR